jgi:hypothetical protein
MRNLYAIPLSFIALSATNTETFSQCTSDNSCTTTICPDPQTDALPDAQVGFAYQTTFTINVPTDTTVTFNSINYSGTVNKLTINSIDGLPTSGSLTMKCSSDNCEIIGGNRGCLELSGTPIQGDDGEYTVTVNTTTDIDGIPIGYDNPFIYTLTIKEGIATFINKIDADLVQIYPNPATSFLTINADLIDGRYELINSLGLILIKGDLNKKTNILTESFQRGTYFIRITSEKKVLTKKVILK